MLKRVEKERLLFDDAGRLIDEVFNHYDDDFDQTQHFTYDLVGNRLARTLDAGNDASIDQVFASSYDANDRLKTEQGDTDNDSVVDETTTYGYTGTQQTSKSVSVAGQTTQSTAFAYDLQGRMQQVTIESLTGGVVTRRELVEYDYDSTGIRVSAKQSIDADADDVYEEVKETKFLVDHQNFTGYQQVLEEVTTDGSANVVKRIVYTLGHDNISQTFYDAANPNGQTHVFHYDGHGSTRVLTDLTGAILQMYAFDAYGVALGFDPAAALTSVLYSGEQFDARIGQQYLRARYYDPATGRFNRLDPFFGNLNDPQSFHKYLYTHGDPVNGWDPTGLLDTAVSATVTTGTASSLASSMALNLYVTFALASKVIQTLNTFEALRLSKQLKTDVKTKKEVQKERDQNPNDIYFVHGSHTSSWGADAIGINPTRPQDPERNSDFGIGFYTFKAEIPGFIASAKRARAADRHTWWGIPFLLIVKISIANYNTLTKKDYGTFGALHPMYVPDVNAYRHGLMTPPLAFRDIVLGPTARQVPYGSGNWQANPNLPLQYKFETLNAVSKLKIVAVVPVPPEQLLA